MTRAMPVTGVCVDSSGQKTVVPLENNPDVFTALLHDLGGPTTKSLRFHDVYSVDDAALLALVPRPVLALVLISPPGPFHVVRAADGRPPSVSEAALTYGKTGSSSSDEPVLWFRQTIGHACGLMALIHAAANSPTACDRLQSGSLLDRLLRQAAPLAPAARAALLYDSAELEETHMRAAVRGDSAAPLATDPCELHFVAFVRGRDDHLWELEGSSDGPIDRGPLPEDATGNGDGTRNDMLTKEALALGVGRFLAAAEGDVAFSIIALTSAPEDARGG
ncbi:ubiquitin c-terminal hydrolase l3 [Grosmannia clavigera kw1407]|uniref:Ubiquitin carboxyl-terminal hydrolase n=1 Tax=Grosmannia clavigera (strain kw1407 / UAMH 11150) TaxID=655863 RepID=F0XH38_GROCL|nr:ubiquitin c-terminal hydrolase l3 [Grosmannia clavigera kw1407]EFX02746.1 ubiquitin c-terminal hydrolase l3 [Grosmannia clavigera kw1407]